MAHKYSIEFIDKIKSQYQSKPFPSVPDLSRKNKIPQKTLYRWRNKYHWDEVIIEKAKTMYLEERQKLTEISRVLNRTVNEISTWKKKGKWDAEIFIIGNIGLSRKLNEEFVKEVRTALKENRIAEAATADKLTKLLKIIERLNPERIKLANVYQLLQDLTEFVCNLGDNDFSELFKKYLPEMSDYLREKYAS